jgi:predicted nucleic acid-binding Zn ribbon protein
MTRHCNECLRAIPSDRPVWRITPHIGVTLVPAGPDYVWDQDDVACSNACALALTAKLIEEVNPDA